MWPEGAARQSLPSPRCLKLPDMPSARRIPARAEGHWLSIWITGPVNQGRRILLFIKGDLFSVLPGALALHPLEQRASHLLRIRRGEELLRCRCRFRTERPQIQRSRYGGIDHHRRAAQVSLVAAEVIVEVPALSCTPETRPAGIGGFVGGMRWKLVGVLGSPGPGTRRGSTTRPCCAGHRPGDGQVAALVQQVEIMLRGLDRPEPPAMKIPAVRWPTCARRNARRRAENRPVPGGFSCR